MIHHRLHAPNILFVGINPHPGSYSRGVPFSNNKLFWYLLSDAGVLPYTREQLREDSFLQELYAKRFNQEHKLGLINMIDRPSISTVDLIKDEELPGRRRLAKVIRLEKPKVVCFVGKISYEKFVGHKSFDFGWQGSIGDSKIYVMHFPLRGKASIRVAELKEVKKAVK